MVLVWYGIRNGSMPTEIAIPSLTMPNWHVPSLGDTVFDWLGLALILAVGIYIIGLMPRVAEWVCYAAMGLAVVGLMAGIYAYHRGVPFFSAAPDKMVAADRPYLMQGEHQLVVPALGRSDVVLPKFGKKPYFVGPAGVEYHTVYTDGRECVVNRTCSKNGPIDYYYALNSDREPAVVRYRFVPMDPN